MKPVRSETGKALIYNAVILFNSPPTSFFMILNGTQRTFKNNNQQEKDLENWEPQNKTFVC